MTGFDRVLIYRFDEQWNGTVIAEDRNEVLPSYLDLRFPASDIPAQARELYRRNRHAHHPRCQLHAGSDPVARAPTPLDLSDSVLRSVSPVHLEYMRNMGTLASMSISILRDGEPVGPDLLPQQGAEAGVAAGAQRLRLPHPDLLPAARGAGEHGARREPGAARRRPGAASRPYGGGGSFHRRPREPSRGPDAPRRRARGGRRDAGPLLAPGADAGRGAGQGAVPMAVRASPGGRVRNRPACRRSIPRRRPLPTRRAASWRSRSRRLMRATCSGSGPRSSRP